jgi:hypothetical protein
MILRDPLSLKRPDTLLCLCKPNIGGAAKQVGFAPSTLALNNYWDKVVEVLRASEWYAAPRPTGADAVLWDNRAAMLDTISMRRKRERLPVAA